VLRLVFDVETDGLLPQLTKLHCIELLNADTGEQWGYGPKEIERGIAELEAADEIIGHNIIGFDIPAIKKVYRDFKTKAKVTDTLVLSHLLHGDLKNEDWERNWRDQDEMPKRLYGSHSLKAWGIRLGDHKDDFDGGDWKAWSPDMQKYCRQDVALNHRLLEHLDTDNWSQESIDLEHQAAELCFRIGNNGWTFDRDKASQLYADLAAERSTIEAELHDLFEPWEIRTPFIPKANNSKYGYEKGVPTEKVTVVEFNYNSRRHIERCLKHKYDWKPKLLTGSGHAQIDEVVLGGLNYPEAQKLSRMFLLQKRLGQLAEGRNAWMKLVNTDGRLRHQIVPSGTVSGRAAHRFPNLGQVPRATQPFGKTCRELFTVPPGFSLVGSDLSGIELRMLAHYLDDGGAYAKQILEGDIHTFNQKAAGLETRDQAKTMIYALCYGAGPARLGEILGAGFKEGKQLQDRFFAGMPAFVSLKRGIQKAADRGYLKSLDGRRVPIRSAHSALNTLLQSAAGCISKKWICLVDTALRDEGLDDRTYTVAWVHDEIQIACLQGIEDHVGTIAGRMAQEAGRAFNLSIPIDAEYSWGTTWADSH